MIHILPLNDTNDTQRALPLKTHTKIAPVTQEIGWLTEPTVLLCVV